MQSEFGIRHSKKQNRPGCGQPLHNDWINNTLLRNYPELVHQLHRDSRKSAGADRHRWGRATCTQQKDDRYGRQAGQDAVRKTLQERQKALTDLVDAIREYRNPADQALKLRGSE